MKLEKSSLVNGERWTQVLVKLLKSNGQLVKSKRPDYLEMLHDYGDSYTDAV